VKTELRGSLLWPSNAAGKAVLYLVYGGGCQRHEGHCKWPNLSSLHIQVVSSTRPARLTSFLCGSMNPSIAILGLQGQRCGKGWNGPQPSASMPVL